MVVLDDWIKTKRRIEELQRQADKVEAEYKHALEQVRHKDKVKTIKAAEARYERKVRLEVKLYRKFVKLEKEFRKKHGRRLGL